MRLRSTVSIALLVAFGGFASTTSGQAANPTTRATRPTVPAADKPLDIYIVDTEGGKATLFLSPSGETVLVATGNPVAHFMDHGPNIESPEQVKGFQAAYEEIYGKARHTILKPGDRVPVKGFDWRIVMSAAHAITTPLVGAGQANATACANFQRKP